ncbi:MAG: TIM barrel protein [Phycisphaerales bacterium]
MSTFPLSRRAFLAAAAGVSATGAAMVPGPARAMSAGVQDPAPGAVPAATGKAKRTLRKAVMYGMIGAGKGVAERLAIVKECGFEGVEIDSPSEIPVDEVIAAARQTGIVVHGVVDSKHWSKPLNHPLERIRSEGVAALQTAIRDAKSLGASSVLLVPGVVNNDLPYDECYTRSQRVIRSVLPLARECGVRIAIENVWNGFLLSPLEAARYVDDFKDHPDGEMVGFHFDIGNVINFGRPAQWARILGARTLKLHIKDFSLKRRDNEGLWKGFDVELGAGDAGWAEVLSALDETGYSTDPAGRWATAEVRGGDAARLKQIASQMDALFAM